MMAYKIFAYSGSKEKSLSNPCSIFSQEIDSINYYQTSDKFKKYFFFRSFLYVYEKILN